MAASQDPSKPNKKPKPFNSYLRYSGLAIQLVATISICGWIGYEIDQWLGLEYPVFLISLVLAGFSGSMYKLYRALNRP